MFLSVHSLIEEAGECPFVLPSYGHPKADLLGKLLIAKYDTALLLLHKHSLEYGYYCSQLPEIRGRKQKNQ